ncbi:DUF1937 family protein [Candidatus Poribacteria bacterium]|nr:DUF1937 family protein [Candidatus Poribacteria bacterium]
MDKKPIIYFANPYRHKNPNVMQHRFETMRTITAQIIQEQNYIIPFTPVVYTHDLSQYCEDDQDWVQWDLQFLAKCDAMVVITLDGWEESEGVQKEIEYCKENEIPIMYLDVEEIDTFIKHSNFRGFVDSIEAEEKTWYQHPDGTKSLLISEVRK